ncbi:MAG: polysaccharide deacetylase family protein [Pseudomonadota bacterium]
MKLALTFDDLPVWPMSWPPAGYSPEGIADAMIAALRKHDLEGVYCFSNSWALDEVPELWIIFDRWVAAGHHVGNHTHAHQELQQVTVEAYCADIDLCAERLAKWIDRAPQRLFRYTRTYWGEAEEKRAHVAAHLAAGGWGVADITSMLFEWEWNRAFKAIREDADVVAMTYLRETFLDFAAAQVRYDVEILNRYAGREAVGILLLHNVAFLADVLSDLLARLKSEGVEFVQLAEALADPVYAEVGSIVSTQFLPYPHKMLRHRSEKVAAITPDRRALFNEIRKMAGDEAY